MAVEVSGGANTGELTPGEVRTEFFGTVSVEGPAVTRNPVANLILNFIDLELAVQTNMGELSISRVGAAVNSRQFGPSFLEFEAGISLINSSGGFGIQTDKRVDLALPVIMNNVEVSLTTGTQRFPGPDNDVPYACDGPADWQAGS